MERWRAGVWLSSSWNLEQLGGQQMRLLTVPPVEGAGGRRWQGHIATRSSHHQVYRGLVHGPAKESENKLDNREAREGKR